MRGLLRLVKLSGGAVSDFALLFVPLMQMIVRFVRHLLDRALAAAAGFLEPLILALLCRATMVSCDHPGIVVV